MYRGVYRGIGVVGVYRGVYRGIGVRRCVYRGI